MGYSIQRDAHHIALFRMAEGVASAGLVDEVSGNAIPTHGNPLAGQGIGGPSRTFDGATQYAVGAANLNAAVATKLLGEWTIEVQCKLRDSAGGPLAVFVEPSGLLTVEDSYLAAVRVTASGYVQVYWEQLPATPLTATTVTQSQGTKVGSGQESRVAVVKSLNADGTHYDVAIYVNGRPVQTFTGLSNAAGGSHDAWHIACDSVAPSGGLANVEISEVIVSDIARSAREMYANWVAATRANKSFGAMLKQLLPRGSVWLLDATSRISKLLSAVGDEFTRVTRRVSDLIEETDPRTATETLEDWERVLGLPDNLVTDIPAMVAQRRVAVTQKFLKTGGSSRAYFIDLAAACGYTVTIVDGLSGSVSRSGAMRSGDALADFTYAFYWQVVVSATAPGALTHTQFEAVINSAKPAHTVATFSY